MKHYIKPYIYIYYIDDNDIICSNSVNICDGKHGWENCKGKCGHSPNASCHNHGKFYTFEDYEY